MTNATRRARSILLRLVTVGSLGGCGGDDDASIGGTSETTTSGGESPDTGDATSGDGTTAAADSSGDQSSGDGASSSDTGSTDVCPDAVALPGEMTFPEGIASADDGTLYVGSGNGEIFAVTACDPSGPIVTTLVESGGAILGTNGLRVGPDQSVLWACSSDFTFQAAPAIVGVDRADGSIVAVHTWPDIGGICNDLAFDDAGNLYATDSFRHRLMRVAVDDLDGDSAPEIWSSDPLFVVPDGEFGVNGIAFDPSGALLVVEYFAGADVSGSRLFRVPIEAGGDAGAAELVEITSGPILGGDGLIPDGDGRYLVVEGFAPALSRLTIAGSGASIERLATDLDFPTTVARVGDDAWVVESQFDHLPGSGDGMPDLPFVIVRRGLVPQ